MNALHKMLIEEDKELEKAMERIRAEHAAQAEREIHEMLGKQEERQIYEAIQEKAARAHGLYGAYREVGFTEDQAWELVKIYAGQYASGFNF